MEVQMKRSAVVLVSCLMATTPVFALTMGERSGVNSVVGVAPTTADFVSEAAMSDMFEIQASQLAQQKDPNAADFAAQMVTDHEKTSTDLKGLVQSANVQLPTDMSPAQHKMLDKLNSLDGKPFAKQYRSDQISAHKTAVSLFQRYAKSGDDSAMKIWAQQTLPTLKHHLQMAKGLKT
jgi:putative membrane protein